VELLTSRTTLRRDGLLFYTIKRLAGGDTLFLEKQKTEIL
jgi:hypothetical protein